MTYPITDIGWDRPPGIAQLKRDHSLSIPKGLVYASVLSDVGGSLVNLATGKFGTQVNGVLPTSGVGRGPAAQFVRASSQYINTGSDWNLSGASNLSIFALIRFRNIVNANTENIVSSTFSGNNGFSFYQESGAGSAPDRTFKLGFTLGGVVAFTDSSLVAGGDVKYIPVGMTFQTNIAAGLNYYAGNPMTNVGSVTTATRAMSGGGTVALGANVNFAVNYGQFDLAAVYVWNKLLSLNDFLYLGQNPFGLIAFNQNAIWSGLRGSTAVAAFIAAKQKPILQAVNRAGTY